MEKMVTFSRLFSLLMASTLAYLLYVVIILHRSTPDKLFQQKQILFHISNQSITSVKNTKHFTVGAYREHRVKGHVVRIISIFRRDSVQPLYCLFCCGTHCTNGLKAEVQMHSDHFGFPFVTTDVLCPYPANCNPLYVALSTQVSVLAQNHTFLSIQNLVNRKEVDFPFNFTVCVSNLFGDYNNVLQFTQTLEMYKLLGVQRVVIYNTSSGPDLKRLLQSYAQEGFVEVVQWPIDQHMDPSRGWLFSEHGGDIHYYGQLTTLNDCIYRHMYQSRYILLNDIDEIIVPYQHETLPPMMEALQSQHPKAEVFLIENHIFPKTQFDPSRRFNLPRWRNVPGINIMEHIYKEEPDYKNYHPYKIIVRPRGVEQTSVHEVLRSFGETVQVPPKVCHIIHVRVPLRKGLTKENLLEDKRVWDYKGELVSNVDKALERAGLLTR
ncbi:glycosyltransferase family 92 protein F13G3.3 isoform X2 [Esox lucius]|nr:glycosyltransferase family 92 protein F13G3.3 isoform X2 [Esox lucius]